MPTTRVFLAINCINICWWLGRGLRQSIINLKFIIIIAGELLLVYRATTVLCMNDIPRSTRSRKKIIYHCSSYPAMSSSSSSAVAAAIYKISLEQLATPVTNQPKFFTVKAQFIHMLLARLENPGANLKYLFANCKRATGN